MQKNNVLIKTKTYLLWKHKKIQEQVTKQLGENYYNRDFILAKLGRQHGYPIVIKTVQN